MNSFKQVKNNSHILTSPSQPPVANMLPTGLRSTDLTKELVLRGPLLRMAGLQGHMDKLKIFKHSNIFTGHLLSEKSF
jgi:hypothetical protein